MNTLNQPQPLILMVDDEPALLGQIESLLTAAGFACHCCTTFEAALAKAETARPDLIVSDINLRGRSGLELCVQIRQLDGVQDLPVMFLCAAQIPDIIRRSDEAGGAYYLRKPFDPAVLVELIHKALWLPHRVAAYTGRQTASV